MATLEELYARYFPGQDQRGEYDAYNMSYSGGLTPQQLAYKAAQSGNVDDWVFAQQQANIPMGYEDSYAMTGYGPQGPSTFNPLGFYGGQREPVVRDALQAIAQSAGVPNYDWTPAINKMGMQLAAEYGGQSPTSETRLSELIRRIAVNADPQIQQTYQQIAPQINPVLEDQYTQIWNQSKDYKSDKFKSNVLKMAAIALGGYLGATYGAAAGGSTGAAAGGSGAAAGGSGTAAGLTASEWAAGLSASELAGGTAAAGAAGAAGSGSVTGASGEMAAGGMASGGAAAGGGSGAYSAGGGEFGPAATTAPGEAGYLGSDGAMTATTGTTNTLPGQAAGGGTALSRILSGNGTASDYASLFGTGVDIYGAYQQRQDTKEIADRYFGMGQPYRDRLGALYSDPTAFLNSPEVKIPVQQGTDALARALSTQGNPVGSGSALHEIQNYASNQLFGRLGQEKDRLAGFGGLTAYNSAAPGAAANAVGANANFYNSISGGIADMTTPRNQPNSLADILKQYNTAQGLV